VARSESQTKSQVAYEKIRMMVVTHEFSDDHAWSMRKLAAKLGMSVVPITEAIRRLEQEGILEVHPQRGISLKQLSLRQLQDIAIVREGLEVQAARLVAAAADRALIDKLRRLVAKLQQLLKAGKYEKAAHVDLQIHKTLVDAAGCDAITERYDHLITMSMITTGSWKIAWSHDEFHGPSSHQTLVDAIAQGDPELADRAMRRHIHSVASQVAKPDPT